MTRGTAPSATIPQKLGLTRHSVFAVMPGGQALLIGDAWTGL